MDGFGYMASLPFPSFPYIDKYSIGNGKSGGNIKRNRVSSGGHGGQHNRLLMD
jgi:hypothetical protein